MSTETKIRTYQEELRQDLELAKFMPIDVATFLNQLAHADAQTLIGNYVVIKSKELVRRYGGQ
jgi:hypothetical protein